MDILKDDVKKLYLKYFFPTVGSALITSIYILFDTIFIGQGVGANGLAALNIILPIYSVIFGIGYALGIGGSTVMAIERGRGHKEKADQVATLAIIIGFLSSIILVLILVLFIEDIAYMLGATEVTIELIKEYMSIINFGTIPFILGATMQGLVRADGVPKRAMVATITGGVLNIILDYIFVMPLGMGMFGAALATFISYCVSSTLVITHLLSKKNNIKLNKNCFKFNYLTRIIKCGIPSFFIEMSAGIVIYLFNTQLLKYVGNVGITAYSIISNSAMIVTSILNGICQTIQPLVSTNIGAKKLDRALALRKIALTVGTVFGVVYAFIGFLFPEVLINIFVTPTEEILNIAIIAIRIYFCSFFVLGANMVIGGFFQAIEMPKVAILISVIRGLVLISIFVFLLPALFGINGIWMSVPLTEALTLILTLYLSRKILKQPKKYSLI